MSHSYNEWFGRLHTSGFAGGEQLIRALSSFMHDRTNQQMVRRYLILSQGYHAIERGKWLSEKDRVSAPNDTAEKRKS